MAAMSFSVNPFMPGAGVVPVEMVGRDAQTARFSSMLGQIAFGRDSIGLMVYGMRGVGKTSLLVTWQEQAEETGFTTLRIETTGVYKDDMGELEQRVAERSSAIAAAKNAVSHIESVTTPFGAVTVSHDETKDVRERILENLMPLINAAKDRKRGVLLFIDEFQEADAAMIGWLLSLQQRMVTSHLPFYLVIAGLPNLPGVITGVRSYAERLFLPVALDSLTPEQTRKAFQDTARVDGRSFTDDALERLAQETDGYPFFIQVYGNAVWNGAESTPMTVRDVDNARAAALDILDGCLYRSRWQRATVAQKRFMRAMASSGQQDVPQKALEEALAVSGARISALKEQLIEHGLIFQPEYGKVSFTVPGMEDYILREHPADQEPYEHNGAADDD